MGKFRKASGESDEVCVSFWIALRSLGTNIIRKSKFVPVNDDDFSAERGSGRECKWHSHKRKYHFMGTVIPHFALLHQLRQLRQPLQSLCWTTIKT